MKLSDRHVCKFEGMEVGKPSRIGRGAFGRPSGIGAILTAIAALSLASCAALPNDHPAKMVSSTDTGLQDPAKVDAAKILKEAGLAGEWWKSWKDPLLNEILAKGLKDSPDRLMAMERLRESEAMLDQGRSLLGPSFAMDGGLNRQKMSQNGLMPGGMGGKPLNIFNMDLKGNWTLDYLGKNADVYRSALGMRRAALYESEAARMRLVMEMVNLYVTWQKLEKTLGVIKESMDVTKSLHNLYGKRAKAGLMSLSHIHYLEKLEIDLEKRSTEVALARDAVRRSLAILAGGKPDMLDGRKPGDLPMKTPNMAKYENLKIAILGLRPDLMAMRAMIESQESGVSAARKEFFPNISLGGMAGWQSRDVGDLFVKPSSLFNFMPAITLPIFNSGRLNANLKGKEAKRNEAVIAYNKALMGALADVSNSMATLKADSRIHGDLERALRVSQKIVSSQKKLVDSGIANHKDYFEAKSDEIKARIALVEQSAKTRMDENKLNFLLGAGFTDPAKNEDGAKVSDNGTKNKK